MFTTQNRQIAPQTTKLSPSADNDNRPRSRPSGTSVFPEEALARIYRPSPSVTTSRRNSGKWTLTFEPRTAPWIEPLMGWTATEDTLTQVRLIFPSLQSAIAYAERQGLHYVVEPSHEAPVQCALRPVSRHKPPATTAENITDLPSPWLDGYGIGVKFDYRAGGQATGASAAQEEHATSRDGTGRPERLAHAMNANAGNESSLAHTSQTSRSSQNTSASYELRETA